MKWRFVIPACGAASALAFAAVPGMADAQSITTSYMLSTGTNTIAGFDPMLGSLNSITLDLSFTAIGFEYGIGLAPSPNPVTTTATLDLAGPFGVSVSSSYTHDAPLGVDPYNTYYSADQAVTFSDQGSLAAATSQYMEILSFYQAVTSGQFAESYSLLNPSASLSVTYNYTPSGTVPSAVPEPASWAMTILGFGLIGAGMRRSRTVRMVHTSLDVWSRRLMVRV